MPVSVWWITLYSARLTDDRETSNSTGLAVYVQKKESCVGLYESLVNWSDSDLHIHWGLVGDDQLQSCPTAVAIDNVVVLFVHVGETGQGAPSLR